jgi:hypothetical protein
MIYLGSINSDNSCIRNRYLGYRRPCIPNISTCIYMNNSMFYNPIFLHIFIGSISSDNLDKEGNPFPYTDLFIYLSIYLSIHIYVCICVYTYTHIHTFIHMYKYVLTYLYIHTGSINSDNSDKEGNPFPYTDLRHAFSGENNTIQTGGFSPLTPGFTREGMSPETPGIYVYMSLEKYMYMYRDICMCICINGCMIIYVYILFPPPNPRLYI